MGLIIRGSVPSLLRFALTACCLVKHKDKSTRISIKLNPVAARAKAWVYDSSLAGIVGSNPAEGMDVCLL